MAHRIQFAQVCDVHARRIREHRDGFCSSDDHVSGRLVRSAVWSGLASGGAPDGVVCHEGFHLHFLLRGLTLDGSQISIRSTDEVRMEGTASIVAREHSRHELRRGDLMIQVLFFFFAALAVGAAINVLVQKHVSYSALSWIFMLTAVSVLFILLRADFLAVIQVIVYAGAIMVLFTFVIMLLNLPQDEDGPDRLRWLKFAGMPLGLFFLFLVVATLWDVEPL